MSSTTSTPKVTPGTIPAGYKAHTESSTTILVPEANTAFLNPVQQYNRDLSIAVIRAWNDMRKEEALAKHEVKMQRKGKAKGKGKAAVEVTGEAAESAINGDQSEAGPSKPVSTSREM
jgi:tRNA (guanine26-N2/guanine27-N2)-dimethyltransferase